MRVSLNNNIIRSDYFIYLFQSKGVVLDQVKELCKGSTRVFFESNNFKANYVSYSRYKQAKSNYRSN